SAQPRLEELEIRLVPAVVPMLPDAGDGTPPVLMQPTYLRNPAPSSPPTSPETLSAPFPFGYTPQQIRTAYGIDSILFGSITGDGSGQTIAIVDAYANPKLVDSTDPQFGSSDLAQFDQRFNLADPPSFTKVGQDGSPNLPGTDPTGDWEGEEAL